MKTNKLIVIIISLLCVSNQSFSQDLKERKTQTDIGVGFFFSENNNGPSIRASYGYLPNKSLFLGAGAGLTYYIPYKGGFNKAPRIPIFLNSKYSLALSQRSSFIVGLEAGYRFFPKNISNNYNSFYAMPKAGVGFKVGKRGKNAISLMATFNRDKIRDYNILENQLGVFIEYSF